MSRLDIRIRRVIAYLAILLLTGLIAPVVAEQPALAQCYSCDGVDPNNNGCTGAQTIYEFTSAHTGVRVELRFSGACGGAWTRLTQPGNARYGTDIFLLSSDGLRYTHHLASGSQEWTNQMRWTRTLRACYGWGFNGGAWNNYSEFSCTPWW